MKRHQSLCVASLAAIGVWLSASLSAETLVEGLARVRAARADGTLEKGAVAEIRLSPGCERLAETLVLGPHDSHLRIVAPKGTATLSGGVILPRFAVGADGVWFADVPKGLRFEQLWVNGRRATRARSPNDGFFYMKRQLGEGVNPLTGRSEYLDAVGFGADPRDVGLFVGRPEAALKDVVVRTYRSWYVLTTRLRHVGADGTVIGTPTRERPYFFWSSYEPRYVLENYREALDAPGEWFLDEAAHRLLYLPRPGETPDTAVAEVPRLEHLLHVVGDRAAGRVVEDVRFENVAFDLAGYMLPPEGGSGSQAAANIGATLLLDGAEGVVFENCAITRTGLHGLWFRSGCRHCALRRSLVEDTGASAVRIGPTRWNRNEPDSAQTAFVTVSDCILRHGGRDTASACGLTIHQASDCLVEHNEIADFLYTGVSVGWTWGYAPTMTRNNRILWNVIRDIGQGVLSDMAGVYTLGRSDGTEVIGNIVRDVWSYDYTGHGGSGLYTDEGSANIRFESNLVCRTKTAFVHQHYGRDNVFRNNVFVDSGETLVRRSRDEDHHCFTFENNVATWRGQPCVYGGGGPAVGRATNLVSRANLLWSPDGLGAKAFFGADWATWRAGGQDADSLFADPLFVDAEKGDYRLRPESPAFRLGFKSWDYAQAGVRGDAAWRAKAAERTCAPLKFAAVPARFGRRAYETGFEDTKMRKGMLGALHLSCSSATNAGFRLVPRQDAKGGVCLEARDAPGLSAGWMPHFYLPVLAEKGMVTFSASLRVEARTMLDFEFRDYHPANGQGYAAGPALRFHKGRLLTGQKALAVPVDAWFDVAVTVDLDRRTYSVTVTHDGASETAQGLPIRSSAFVHLEWLGFMTTGDTPTVWSIDDLKFKSIPTQR